jgi:hypothetical protein
VITPVDEDEADGEPETVDAPAAEAPADEVAHGPSAEQSAPAKA